MIEKTHRTYKATYGDVPLHAEPESESPTVGVIRSGTTLEVTKREHQWVRVAGTGGVEGWANATAMERIMERPAADLEFYSNGHRVIDGQYRNYFGITNVGLADFNGQLKLRLYTGGTSVRQEKYTFTRTPIISTGGRAFHVDTPVEIAQFEFETTEGKYRATTKGLIQSAKV